MGGGISSAAAEQMEEMMAYSVLLGRTITCMSFPGMYSIKDFSVLSKQDAGNTAENSRARRDEQRTVSSNPSVGGSIATTASGDSSEGPPPLIDPELEDKFTVVVDGVVIVLDDVTKQNEDGWTPLHACCHSNTTAAAGLRILEEMVSLGGDLDLKTKKGPGSFNSGFTPLHMASAYGVVELVEALLKAGASPNCRNTFDWTPLLEACHRGFVGIVRTLVAGGADLSHVPNADASCGAHVMRGAPQSSLGEAARGGFTVMCKFLLNSGSQIDQENHLGWTPLHEACYFNRLDTVQLLLVHGADPTAKNAQGAMPFNLATFQPIKDVLKEIGGEEATKMMPTPVFSLCMNEKGHMFVQVTAGEPDKEEKEEHSTAQGNAASSTRESDERCSSRSPRRMRASPSRSKSKESTSPGVPAGSAGGGSGSKDHGLEGGEILHKGDMLGELPALGRAPGRRQKTSVGDGDNEDVNSLRMPGETDEGRAPESFICQLSKRLVRDPVRSPYGHLFDRQMIGLWLSKQGSICPLSGQPLVASELKNDDQVAAELRRWRKDSVRSKKVATGECRTRAYGREAGAAIITSNVGGRPERRQAQRGSPASAGSEGRPLLTDCKEEMASAVCGSALLGSNALDATASPKGDGTRDGAATSPDGRVTTCGDRKDVEDDDDGLYDF